MKKLKLKLILITLLFFFNNNVYAINNYDYPKKNLEPGICKKIFSELNFPHPNYELEDPTILSTDLYVDKIFEVTPKDSTFKAQVNLWITWKELRLIPILKNIIYLLMMANLNIFVLLIKMKNFQILKCLILL